VNEYFPEVNDVLVHVPIDRLRKGMFIETVECPTAEFPKRRFLLDTAEDQDAIRASSAERVLINTALGDAQFSKWASARAPRPYPQEELAEREHVAATLTNSVSTLKQNMERVRGGSVIDVDILAPVALMMADIAHDAPTVMLQMTRLKSKDEGSYLHSLVVGALMSKIGVSLGLDAERINQLGIAGILHDIGKLLVPADILSKAGALTTEERHVIRSHPDLGHSLLNECPNITPLILDVCRHHHEALDGSGYPQGLKAGKISQDVRIATVCDVFDALTSKRSYKKPWSAQAAIAWMFDRPQIFDNKIVLRLSAIIVPKSMD